MNNNHSITKKWQENNPNATGVWGERIYNNGNLNDETFLKKNLLFPIPRDEMNTNIAITKITSAIKIVVITSCFSRMQRRSVSAFHSGFLYINRNHCIYFLGFAGLEMSCK